MSKKAVTRWIRILGSFMCIIPVIAISLIPGLNADADLTQKVLSVNFPQVEIVSSFYTLSRPSHQCSTFNVAEVMAIVHLQDGSKMMVYACFRPWSKDPRLLFAIFNGPDDHYRGRELRAAELFRRFFVSAALAG